MTREMGTLGKDVAQGIADSLGLKIIHSELIEHDLATRLGVQESAVHRYLEGGASVLERWKIDKEKLSRYTAEELLEFAREGNVIIRGWGAVAVLRAVPHVLRVRVCAPMPFRERVIMERLELKDASEARSAALEASGRTTGRRGYSEPRGVEERRRELSRRKKPGGKVGAEPTGPRATPRAGAGRQSARDCLPNKRLNGGCILGQGGACGGASEGHNKRENPARRLAPNSPGSRAAPRAIGANVRSATPAYRQNERAADVFHAV
jgi:cytidylate kinase